MSKRPVVSLIAVLALAGTAVAGFRLAATGERGGDRAGERKAEGDHGLETYEEVLARESWFYGPRVAPGRVIPADARLAATRAARDIAAASRNTEAASAAWTNLGPQPVNTEDPRFNDINTNGSVYQNGFGNVSGRITALATPPGTPNTVYLGAADGGVWKTTDGGAHWTPIGDQLDSLAIGAIAVAGGLPNRIYVGTGEANTNSDAYYGAGIFKSDDGGATFTKVGGTTFDKAIVYRIIASKGKVIAATSHGLYRSTNAGATWTQVLAPGGTADPFGNFVSEVVFAKGNGLVAAIGWRAGDPNNGLYQSTNGGTTWTKLAPVGFPAQQNLGRISLAATGQQAGLMYAVIQDAVLLNAVTKNTVLNGVYKSTTGPSGPWQLVATSQVFASDPDSALSPTKIGPTYQPGIQAWYNQYVVIDPTNPNDVVVGLEEVYNSSDGGSTWHTIGRYWNVCITDPGPPGCWQDPIQHPTTHPDQHAAVFTTVGGQPKLYVGSDGGAWSQVGPSWSNDNWTNLNSTLSITQPYYAEASSGLSAVYIGNQDNGTTKYEGTSTWPQIFGGDGGDVAVDPSNPDITYEEYVYMTMSSSSNGGVNWNNDINPADGGSSSTARFISPFDMDPTDSNHLVTVGQHVWESHAGIGTTSSSWTNDYDNGTGHVGTALAVHGATIYEGWCGPSTGAPAFSAGCNPMDLTTDNPFVRGMATNYGGTWHALDLNAAGLPNRYIQGVAVDPGNDAHIFVGFSGFSRHWIPNPGAGYGHIFESTNGGATFTDISSNLPDAPVNDMVLFNGRLIAATDVGVFERQQDGTWGTLGTGLPQASVLDISLVPGGSTLVAATHGRGVWTIPLA